MSLAEKPSWARNMPARVSFIDTETTGLRSFDRIVSIGIIKVETEHLIGGRLIANIAHLIFDPGVKSHPVSENIHGYDDWVLRHQDVFATHARQIASLIFESDLIVAHNASFDMEFIIRELKIVGIDPPKISVYCTMNAVRNIGVTGSASLASVCEKVGIKRLGEKHGALEDAWMAMQLYFLIHKCPAYDTPFSALQKSEISNYREPPPRPDGQLPRRKKKSV